MDPWSKVDYSQHIREASMEMEGLSEVIPPSSRVPGVRPDMRYCFRSGHFRPNPRTKHISVPPRHMTKSYIPYFNMISQHYRYKDTTSHTIGIQVLEYNTTTEDTCLSTDYSQVPIGESKTHQPT